jgi:hypothetical protein
MAHDGSDRDDIERDADGPEPAEAEIVEASADGELAETDGTTAPDQPLGVIDRFRFAQLRTRKELEAVEIVLDARLDELRRAADAASQQSKARWDARTAEVVTALKTVVQAQLRSIETERMEQRFQAIERAYELFASKVREVETGPLPEDLRGELIQKLRANLTATLQRLEDDTLADRYDLTD